MKHILSMVVGIVLVTPAFGQADDTARAAAMKARDDEQFAKVASVCAEHVASTAGGVTKYERGYEECIIIMQRKALREADPDTFR